MIHSPASRLAAAATLPILLIALCAAHVGDNNTYYRGAAGPYLVQVVIRHPGVVPGLADITVRVENGAPDRVTVQPVRNAEGLDGAPRPDIAEPVPGEPGLFAAQLWFMTLGSHSVNVEVSGPAGSGIAVVPVMSNATRTLPMSRALGAALAALGLFLALGLLTIVRAAVGESTVPTGESPGPARRLRARLAVGIAVVLLFLVVSGGRAWWRSEAEAYRGILFVPLELRTTLNVDGGTPVIGLTVADRNWLGQPVSPLVPDHGKLMHAFLVRLPDGDAFAHVHPQPTGSFAFQLVPPPLPAGRYAFYGDIVTEAGTAQTLTTEIELPDSSPCAADDATCPATDADDAWTAAPASDTDAFAFEDGVRIRWERPDVPIVAGQTLQLRFAATDAAGSPVALDPYMGMAAHAAVRRDDGAVFVHLHPTGSVSMAAQARLALRAGLAADTAHAAHPMTVPDGVVEILYAFPEPGRYRLWLQVRTGERVRTAAWQVVVAAE